MDSKQFNPSFSLDFSVIITFAQQIFEIAPNEEDSLSNL
jgi:hypothetical protein